MSGKAGAAVYWHLYPDQSFVERLWRWGASSYHMWALVQAAEVHGGTVPLAWFATTLESKCLVRVKHRLDVVLETPPLRVDLQLCC